MHMRSRGCADSSASCLLNTRDIHTYVQTYIHTQTATESRQQELAVVRNGQRVCVIYTLSIHTLDTQSHTQSHTEAHSTQSQQQ